MSEQLCKQAHPSAQPQSGAFTIYHTIIRLKITEVYSYSFVRFFLIFYEDPTILFEKGAQFFSLYQSAKKQTVSPNGNTACAMLIYNLTAY